MRIKRTLLAMLILALCVFVSACSGSDSGSKKSSEKKSDKSTSSASENKASDDNKSSVPDLLGGDKKDTDVKASDTDGLSEQNGKTDIADKNDKNGDATGNPGDEKGNTDPGGNPSGDKDTGTSGRNIVHKFFELESVNGYTREQLLNDEDLAADLGMWEFLTYGTGVEVSFDYDEGYIQYTWYAVSPNAYSTAPIDNPSDTDYMLDYTDFLNMGDQPDWIPISVRYSDDMIVLTFTEGGGTHVYKLTE